MTAGTSASNYVETDVIDIAEARNTPSSALSSTKRTKKEGVAHDSRILTEVTLDPDSGFPVPPPSMYL
ncbi:hypothetical protein AgCh_011700 [Apium graveolens]